MNMTIYEYKSRCEWLAKFYAEAAETGNPMLLEGVKTRASPTLESDFSNWRLKPEPQKAWVVWTADGRTFTRDSRQQAEELSNALGGTIQEITRPEPQ